MALQVMNNIAGLAAQGNLNSTSNSLQSTLTSLSSGKRINSGADDPAGLAISDTLGASVAALNQSVLNINQGIGQAQTADGALAAVTNLLNRAVTLAVQNNGDASANTEFLAIQTEIGLIAGGTNYGSAGSAFAQNTVYISDGGTTPGTITVAATDVSAAGANTIKPQGGTLAQIQTALNHTSAARGALGASINSMQAASATMQNEITNVTAGQNSILATNIPQAVADMSKYSILEQTGISALTQSNTQQNNILGLFR